MGHPSARQRLHSEVSADRALRKGWRTQTLEPDQDDLGHAEEEGGGAGLGTEQE